MQPRAVTKYTDKRAKKQLSGIEWFARPSCRLFSPTIKELSIVIGNERGRLKATKKKAKQSPKGTTGELDATRTLQITTRVHPDQRRLRDRAGQRVAFSLCGGRIRRCGVRIALPDLSRDPWHSDLGHGARGWSRKPKIGRASVRPSRTTKNKVALLQMGGAGRPIPAHDVLHLSLIHI